MKTKILIASICCSLLFVGCSKQTGKKITFTDGDISKQSYSIASLNRDIPSDWSDYKYMILTFRASSPQRFEVGLRNPEGYIFKRIHPFSGALVRFVVTLDFYRQQPTKGNDMAATWNQPRTMGFMNVEHGGFGKIGIIDSIMFRMITPLGNPTLEIQSVSLSNTDPGDSLLSPQKLIDKFGQWIPEQWEGKVKTIEELQSAWAEEDKNLTPGDFNYGKFGGYLNTQAKATGFFRVEKINNRWWFVDPEGHLFLSTSVNGIGPGSIGGSMRGRDSIFEEIPPQQANQFGNRPNNPGQNPGMTQQRGNSPQNPVANQQSGNQPQNRAMGNRRNADFLGWNLQRRYGDNYREKAIEMTSRRINAWGFTTGGSTEAAPRPFIANFRAGGGAQIMGIPDVYSKEFSDGIEQSAKQQLVPQKDNKWLIGYWIANEPPWPNRESLAVSQILAGPDTETRRACEAFMKEGDTPERRLEFCKQTFQKYLDMMVGTIRKYDPNHLILGIRFGGNPPDYIIKMAGIFDIYSLNTYAYKPDAAYLDKVYALAGRPMLIGEFHFGTPGRGMSSGLCQVKDQFNRGVAYSYYVENGFAHPALIGAHWFQWTDEPSIGRMDGENYNIGIIDVTDRPYKELTQAITQTHKNLGKIHAGEMPPTTKMAEGKVKVDFNY